MGGPGFKFCVQNRIPQPVVRKLINGDLLLPNTLHTIWTCMDRGTIWQWPHWIMSLVRTGTDLMNPSVPMVGTQETSGNGEWMRLQELAVGGRVGAEVDRGTQERRKQAE